MMMSENDESVTESINKDIEFDELNLTEGITVWGANQEVLEEQALTELDIFARENRTLSNSAEDETLEEGEIVETAPEIKTKTSDVTLDLDSYIKTQEALKKVQDFRRSLAKDNRETLSKKLISKVKKGKSKKVNNSNFSLNIDTKNLQDQNTNVIHSVNENEETYTTSLEINQESTILNTFSNVTENITEEGEIIETILENEEQMPGVSLNIETSTDTQQAVQKIHCKKLLTKDSEKTVDNIRQYKKRKLNRDKCEDRGEDTSFDNANEGTKFSHDEEDERESDDSGSEYAPSEDELDYVDDGAVNETSVSRKRKMIVKGEKVEKVEKVKDDGLWDNYKSRLKLYYNKLEEELSLKQIDDETEEESDHHLLKGGLKVPINIWNRLYGYQQEGVKWLWKLHRKETGGILGDEMGLGKTVQIIAFLQALETSRIMSCHGRFNGLGPSLIVCPATVIHQWVKHFHEWAPEFRVAVLHQSGSFQGEKTSFLKEMHKTKGIVVTTYLGILKYKSELLDYNWNYVILDEGHKIRNPTAKVTTAAKHIRTPHRILLTGSPMQNNLTELWSLFDFTNPGMLGNSTTFQEHFASPILHGGFANSTPTQEATALSVATTLKDLITPYLLRRSKNEVQHHISLPNKSEQVLFCSLTNEQKDLYKGYLLSDHVDMILGRGGKNWFSENHVRANVLVAITRLRKICNHPDIYLYENENVKTDEEKSTDDSFGHYKKSGKMIVVSALLKIWKKQGHRVLLFTQSRSMIAIFQNFLQQGYKYLKMDGTTSVTNRQPLIDKFNQDMSYDVFLLTTRVGGLGINLTGANRVIIYDPDWNPATDTQARERAWRIGQDKEVTIYRLLSAGTIEEKMYQRQVWKQLLSNKVLLDPRTSRFFKSSDLHDLLSLQESADSNPETANIFHNSRVRIQETIKNSKKDKKSKKSAKNADITFSEDKIQAMKNLAQQIAKSMSRPEVKKTSLQVELEEERQKKLKDKEELKQLPPETLLIYNRDKASYQEDNTVNRIDDSEAKVGFSEALEYAEKTAKLHHVLNTNKSKEPEEVIKKAQKIHKDITKDSKNPLETYKQLASGSQDVKQKKKKKERGRVKIDTSGTIDGEHVDGLVKTEIKKGTAKQDLSNHETHDDFVLGKLFQKKGVSGALQHESIMQGSSQGGSLRIHTEARQRAEKSLEALRKSRLDNWRW